MDKRHIQYNTHISNLKYQWSTTSKTIQTHCKKHIGAEQSFGGLGAEKMSGNFAAARQWMKGDVINETGELSMLPHYFMGMNKKLFLEVARYCIIA